MSRTTFGRAVLAAWTATGLPGRADPWMLTTLADHFADLVDVHAPALPYEDAVVIEGDRVIVAHWAVYAVDAVALEARAGEVTSVLAGADLLDGRIAPGADRRPLPF